MLTSWRNLQPGNSLARILFYECFRRFLRALLVVFFGLRGDGAERVPAHGPLLIAANHQSYLDPPAIGSQITQRHLTFIAKAGLFKFAPFARTISWLNSIPIREDQGDSAAIKEAIRALEMGRAVLIFPEGSRSDTGEINEFKRGVALLMKRSKAPVLPVAITGAYEAWPTKRRFPRLFSGRVRVLYGTPISYDELMKDGPDAALERIRAEVVTLFERLRAAH